MNKKVKICVSVILLLIVLLIMYVLAMKVKEYKDIKYYEDTYTLDNSGDSYEQKLRNIHDTYPPEFYEYVNKTNTFSNYFYSYEQKPNQISWNVAAETCKEKMDSKNLICIYSIGFGGNNLYFDLGHYPSKGSERYQIYTEFSDNNFINFNIQRNDRMGAYAICTFKDASLTEPVNKIEKFEKPDYMEYPENPYGEVNCYDEGKLYQDIVPLLEKFEKDTIDNIDKLIKLSEDYKNLSKEEVQHYDEALCEEINNYIGTK